MHLRGSQLHLLDEPSQGISQRVASTKDDDEFDKSSSQLIRITDILHRGANMRSWDSMSSASLAELFPLSPKSLGGGSTQASSIA